ncbi:bifunctional biotin--[acetyl-CoA-carboxylase] ligase/biotin operon repressor BirA [Alteromonas sediminis]|uniref:Bifunctional ligase/repressor BirA n=1 Tax=Alteromonas sediminis TaxID=2259342 RepID=A0A3N5Y9E5_9ALTE|nr:bifunctional biotin--[acetyl-CoA-carboxylase] ligase/biotin operon repressor BirA [Alteromonas sediminis]RPJ67859.1 bifunctional biotin--[acetyl-CoA-carboxylase] ligase/biotin operon repressor BirA [Alteromonas sediminis]
MKKQERLERIIKILAPGDFVSGEELASEFEVSRASIATDIRKLASWGADIFSVKGRGYKLAHAFTPLDKDKIEAAFTSATLAPIRIHTCLESTNASMKSAHDWQQGEVLLADIQTHGRGRRGRDWVAPVGSGLTFSMFWRFDQGHQSLTGLSLVVGVAICRALHRLGVVDVGVKWPNDIYSGMSKLGGVLVELEGQLGSSAACIIGVGLNINLENQNLYVDQPVIDIASILNEEPDRNKFAGVIVSTMWETLQEFEAKGFSAFQQEWQSYDVFQGKRIALSMGERQVVGTGNGVDKSGALLLATDSGVESFHGGEVSLRGFAE